MNDDRRLIEDYLPIQAISAEASREKSIRKGHISTLHLWWARRPLVACRAAVYGALVPASRFQVGQAASLSSTGRANAAKFVERLCQYPGSPQAIAEAQKHILEAHAERLSKATGKPITVEDIVEGRAPRPKVLDMFAGGGAIPLEALRLGCEAYALDLNPVAHIVELCTLVYPQKYGKPDPSARGMTGPPNYDQVGRLIHSTTWGGLADEARYWGNWVLEKVKAEIGDLYPPLPDMEWWEHVGQAASLATQSLMFPSILQDVAKTKRKLPHWEKEGACYFITHRTKEGIEISEKARDVVLENWKHWSGQRYDLWQAVIMPDHVHLLLSPLQKDDGLSQWTLSEIAHTAKSYTANHINKLMNRTGPLWQDERFDHIIRDPISFEQKWHYVRQNPCQKGLVTRPEDYKWLYEHNGLAARPTLTPVAYLWTRTVRCKNPTCGATVPLVRQTWLCKKEGQYAALKVVAQAAGLSSTGEPPVPPKKVQFEVVASTSERGLGFDPTAGSKGGNATCPFCGTVADSDYVKAEGQAGRLSHHQMMAIVCTRPGRQGKVYLSVEQVARLLEGTGQRPVPSEETIQKRIEALCHRTGLTMPNEPMPAPGTLGFRVQPYGVKTWGDLFTPRQMLCLLTFAAAVRETHGGRLRLHGDKERAKAIGACLSMVFDKIADISTSLSAWEPMAQCTRHLFGRQAIPMVWDFGETVPIATSAGNWNEHLGRVLDSIGLTVNSGREAIVARGSAIALPWPDGSFDAVITDPPYYDNVPYADISDFFYVWLKRTVGYLYPEHFATEGTPKKAEAVADAVRHGGDKVKAKRAYEEMMRLSFGEAHRVLKPGGQMVVVYAHKTTLGWSTLVDALRLAGFTVMEAWPLDTEMKSRLRAQESAALASSIFLVARKREGAETGSYEDDVRPELERIVRERVDSLWKMGITGADLVIAAVGAGLRAYTRFPRVEYANGEEVPAEKFLAEVEGVVLETLLEKIFGMAGSGVAAVDGPSRFYVLWRYAYKAAEIEAGEAIVFTYGQGVELDGPNGLTGQRPVPLLGKKKGKYRLRDFTERGEDEKLGLPVGQAAGLARVVLPLLATTGWQPAPLIDVLHRILWLVENQPRNLNRFLDEARPDRERLRLVAQALAGTALVGQASILSTTVAEQSALNKLVANWRALIDQRLAADEGTLFDMGRK